MPGKVARLCVVLFLANAACGAEFLIFDQTFTFDESLNGFNFFPPPASAPAD